MPGGPCCSTGPGPHPEPIPGVPAPARGRATPTVGAGLLVQPAGFRRRDQGGPMPPIVEAQGLTKRYGATRALDGLDLTAASGQVVAVLGPNGAGKTTFVRAAATLLRPDEGTLRIAGVDAAAHPERVRRLIGLA